MFIKCLSQWITEFCDWIANVGRGLSWLSSTSPCSSRATYTRLPRVVYHQGSNIFNDRVSTTSLDITWRGGSSLILPLLFLKVRPIPSALGSPGADWRCVWIRRILVKQQLYWEVAQQGGAGLHSVLPSVYFSSMGWKFLGHTPAL